MGRHGAGLVLMVLLLATGCGAPPDGTQLQVSAAASLTDAFTDLVTEFEQSHPQVEVDLNLAGSATLVEQVLRGAPVDVLATADPRTMQRAVDEGAVSEPHPFATNSLVVARPADGPDRDVQDLADPELLVGLCAPQVPCGAAARDALDALGVTPRPDTEDGDVRTLLMRLVRGELDVGVVYATDLAAAPGQLEGDELPGARTTLVIAATTGAPAAAQDFVAFVRSPAGAEVLTQHGFGGTGATP